jgi:dTDP-4-dehydrorhamnose reductase
MPRVVILGASGELGTDLCPEFESLDGTELVFLTHEDLDICDYEAVSKTLASIRPDSIINLAVFRKLEACEDDPDTAFAVNSHAVRNLAVICDNLQARLVHLSTDYVFGGDQHTPYREDAPLNPLNVYGVSKASGEYFVRNLCRNHLVIRTSGLFGSKGTNFVETMLRLGKDRGWVSVVTDQVLSPTATQDLIPTMRALVDRQAQGVYHITNSGSCSWYEFAKAIFELSNSEVEVRPTTTEAFGAEVPRPSYSVLENHRLKEIGIPPLRPWKEALQAYLEAR